MLFTSINLLIFYNPPCYLHIISKNYIFISLFQKLLHSYVKEAAALGVSNMDAKMMCANFRHQGGASAVKRILAKTTKPYTLDHLYAACQTDTGNQVGAYIYVPTLAGLFTNYASPKVGDIFMYHNGSEFSHTGLVISVSGDKFVTIEGNTNDGSGVVAEGIGVYQKTRYNRQLPGSKFARPNYSIVTSINGSGGDITPPSTWVTTGTAVCTGDDVYVRQTPGGTVMGMVSKGTKLELDGTSSGVWVHVKVAGIGIGYMHQDYVGKDSGSTGSSPIKTAQNALNSKFNAGLTVDGIWGSACKTAYIKAIQSALNSVYGAGLTADGIWGTNTSNACAAHVLSEGANNLYVGVLQIGLYAHNITLNSGIDSSFGPSTKQGVIKFQTSQGLSADGIAGRDTFARLAGV